MQGELSAKLTEGLAKPSVKTCGFAAFRELDCVVWGGNGPSVIAYGDATSPYAGEAWGQAVREVLCV